MNALLGIVLDVDKERKNAWVRPLLDADGRVVRPESFPPEGQAFWGNADIAQKDALVFFEAGEHSGKDRFRVVYAERACEVIDARQHGDLEQVRRAVALGISRTPAPTGEAMLWCKNDVLVGPVRFVLGANGLLTLERNGRERIPVSAGKRFDVREVKYGRSQWLVLVPPAVSPTGYVDWDDDRYLLQRVVRGAAARTKTNGVDRALLNRLVEEGITWAQTLDSVEGDLELARIERARTLIAQHERVDVMSRDAMDAFFARPEIQAGLATATRVAEQQAREEVAEKLHFETNELQRLERELEAARRELAVVAADLERSKTERERELEEVATLTRERLRSVLSSPVALAAEASVHRAISGAPPADGSRQGHERRRTTELWTVGGAVIRDLHALRKRLGQSFAARGFASLQYQRLHAAFAARLSPIVAGADALDVARAYAQVTTQARMHVVHVGPTVLEPGDIFGKVDSSGAFVPHPSGLIDILDAATKSTGFVLVVLEGVNRTATEGVLVPLLRAWSRSEPLRLFHPSALRDQAYAECSQISFPPNVLLACTIVNGSATLPLSRDVWSHAIYVDPKHSGVGESFDEISEIDPEAALFAVAPSEDIELDGVFDPPGLPWLKGAALRLARGVRMLNSDAESVGSTVLESLAAPALATLPQERAESALKAHDDDVGEKDSLRELVAAIRETVS